MRREIALLALLIGAAGHAAAQNPGLAVVLQSRTPEVRTTDLLADGKYTAVMRSGLPLRLHYRLELWRVRASWFDKYLRDVQWEVVARHDPLTDEFILIRQDGRVTRYASDDEIARALGIPYRIPLEPSGSGRFYFACRLDVATLNETDLAELERWLRGEPDGAGSGGGGVGSALGRGLQRVLVQIAGLPRLTLEARSPTFRFPN